MTLQTFPASLDVKRWTRACWRFIKHVTRYSISFQCSAVHYLWTVWMAVCWSSTHSVLLLDRTMFNGHGSFTAQVGRCVVCRLPEALLDFVSSWGEQVTQDLYKITNVTPEGRTFTQKQYHLYQSIMIKRNVMGWTQDSSMLSPFIIQICSKFAGIDVQIVLFPLKKIYQAVLLFDCTFLSSQ